jgi:hypothetical protein
MFRKTAIALAAVATLGAAALAPTAASAGHWHHKHHGWKSFHFHAPVFAHGYGYKCWRTKWVKSYYGWRQVRVNVCY